LPARHGRIHQGTSLLLFIFLLTIQTAGTSRAQEPEPLFVETLALDIKTADYYELLAWVRRLGLTDSGDRSQLQARLYEYYAIAPPVEEQAITSKRIFIRSAKSTEYFTVSPIEEDYLLLAGDVVVELQDDEAAVTHRIQAQRILVNQSQKILTATGDIEYVLERRGDEPEIFRGDSFSFNLEDWAGQFTEGRGEIEREVEADSHVTFFYVGDTISRQPNDTVVLDDGSVTSCDLLEDPHWRIEASKIWVLAPEEWAISDAVLYIGRVPVFYLPFFFKPGDEFFFHPSIGYRNREGNFIQTTTYLLGSKAQAESAFSFLRITDSQPEEFEREIRGLFLKRGPRKKRPSVEDNRTLKVLLDVYSRLGGFAGVVGEFPPEVRFKGGIGISRSLVVDPATEAYTPYDTGELSSRWNSSSLLGLILPFRFGWETHFLLRSGKQSASGRFELYSDPFFPEDFFLRAEKVDWSGLLRLPEEEEAAAPTTGWDLLPQGKDNFSWQVAGRLAFPSFPPYLEEFSVSRLDLAFYWQSRNVPNYTEALEKGDPSRKFYFPNRLLFPSATLRIRGSILQIPSLSASRREKEAGEPEPGKGFKVQEQEEEEPESPQESEEVPEEAFLVPQPKGDLAVPSIDVAGSSLTISYDLQPRLLLETQFNHGNWIRPGDVDFGTRFSAINLSGKQRLLYGFDLTDLIRGTGEIAFDGALNGSYNRAADVTDLEWDSRRLSDYTDSGFDLNSTLALSFTPPFLLGEDYSWDLSYGLNWDFYGYHFDTLVAGLPIYAATAFDWSTGTVRSHSLGSSFVASGGDVPDSLAVVAALPPLSGSVAGKLDHTYGLLNTKVAWGYKETDPQIRQWLFDPLSIIEAATLDPWLRLGGSLSLDLNTSTVEDAAVSLGFLRLSPGDPHFLFEQEFLFGPASVPLNKSTTSLQAYGVQASFVAEQLIPITIDTVKGEWKPTGIQKVLVPSSLLLSYSSPDVSRTFWKNRVTLEGRISTSWRLNLQEFTKSILDFTFAMNFSVYQFLEFSLAVSSFNTKTYRYIPAYAALADEPWVNPLVDLLRSFNFFNISDRLLSSFNLRTISMKLVHHLHDWDLSAEYTGKQSIKTLPDGSEEYIWAPVFTISLEWRPIPEIQKQISGNEDGTNLRG
jgi:hypothetical protein